MKVKVISCSAKDKDFANIIPGNEYIVVKIVDSVLEDGMFDVWVRGVDDFVKLLHGEFEWQNGSTNPSHNIGSCSECARVYGSCDEWWQFDKCPLAYYQTFDPD